MRPEYKSSMQQQNAAGPDGKCLETAFFSWGERGRGNKTVPEIFFFFPSSGEA